MDTSRSQTVRRPLTASERALQAADQLRRAEQRFRMAQLGPKAFRSFAATNRLNAIAIAQEWGIAGRRNAP